MKIAYVLNSVDQMGGATKSFVTMLKGVLAQGHRALVVVPNEGGIIDTLKAMGCEVMVLNYRHNIYPYERTCKDYLLWPFRLVYQRWLNARSTNRLKTRLAQYQPDLVHTNVSVIDIGQRAAKALGIPHVYHFREYADIDFGMRYYPSKGRFYDTVQYSICITRGIQTYHGMSHQPMSRVIYNPIASKRSVMPVAEGKREYLLFAGRVEQTKGLDDLIDAYAEAQLTMPLWVAGALIRPQYTSALKAKVAELSLQEKVIFLGARTDVDVLMREARAVIVPSFSEAFGRTTAEAMFQGTVVIGRDTGGTKEQFDNGVRETGAEIGLRFATKKELTDRLRVVTSDSLDDMRQCAFTTVNKLYSEETSVCQVLDFYKVIIESKDK